MTAAELRFDPAFVEETVFLEAGRLPSVYHNEREAVYDVPDAQRRDAAFQQLARHYFDSLGFTQLFTARLEEALHVSKRVELVIVRRVWSRKDEQVELYVGSSPTAPYPWGTSTTLLLGLQVARCRDREQLTAFLRHELMHADDMLDPAIAYDPQAALGGASAPENERIRQRFRILWDLWVHARMQALGWPTLLTGEARRQEVERAFADLDPAARAEIVAAVSGRTPWTQTQLMALARSGPSAYDVRHSALVKDGVRLTVTIENNAPSRRA